MNTSKFVIGHFVDPKTQPVRKIGDPEAGRIEACHFNQLIRVANIRLFRLREIVSERYKDVAGAQLIEQILREPKQKNIFEATAAQITK
jgi:hypothetical protein